ncbi:MAG: SDR family oxidoreductase [Phototrophicaceae bacterium]|jgi:NAD(P)-dependent dehydrogenase (short-subunit alcohol dehydrogenase family)
MGEYSNKVVVITGAAGGLGKVVARRFAEADAKLSLWDLSLDHLNPLVEAVGQANALGLAVNITDEASVDAAIAATVARFGQIDVLLHIAGGFAMPGPVHEGHLDVWHNMIALNATATYIVCGKVAAQMVAMGVKGALVAVSAKPALKGTKNSAAYSASKDAVIRIVEAMADELRDARIRINCILPSIIDTPANRSSMGEQNAEKWVKPEEIAETLLFLASDRASAITGTKLEVYKWV